MTSKPKERDSWCDPHGSPAIEGLVGQIRFPDNGHDLDPQDKAALKKLHGPFQVLMQGCRIEFLCVGTGDMRQNNSNYKELGRSRAISVRQELDAMFARRPLYSGAACRALGGSKDDGRVDVYANHLVNRGPTVMPVQKIVGRLPPRIRFREIHDAIHRPGKQIHWSLASSTSRPVNFMNLPGDHTGNHRSGVLPVVAELANKGAVEFKVIWGLEKLRPSIAWSLMDHTSGGILVFAAIDICKPGATETVRFMFITDFPGVYRNYREAVDRWRRQPRLEATSGNPLTSRIEYRLYWATRA